MKLLVRFLAITLGAALLLTACGYRNPYVYSGPEKSIYVTTWKNRTSELQLDADIYQSLIRWFQKSGSISITKQKEGADLILAGEIISYNLPSLTYGANNAASTVKLRLRVRYILKDLKTDKVLIEQSSEEWTEDFRISPDSALSRDNGDRALDTIIENMGQK
ncbi:MAG: LptE family protein, partial [Desulfofustis sp.]|nr:LptE family protein [Desulfofustis sp.]